jgi:hypothetical protein
MSLLTTSRAVLLGRSSVWKQVAAATTTSSSSQLFIGGCRLTTTRTVSTRKEYNDLEKLQVKENILPVSVTLTVSLLLLLFAAVLDGTLFYCTRPSGSSAQLIFVSCVAAVVVIVFLLHLRLLFFIVLLFFKIDAMVRDFGQFVQNLFHHRDCQGVVAGRRSFFQAARYN